MARKTDTFFLHKKSSPPCSRIANPPRICRRFVVCRVPQIQTHTRFPHIKTDAFLVPEKPFNPVLGETGRHELRFVDGSSVNSVLEQTSHHPPITAFRCEHDAGAFTVTGHFRPKPKLSRIGVVDVDIEGVRVFEVRVDATSSINSNSNVNSNHVNSNHVMEQYVSNFVGFEWHFFPAMRAKIQTQVAHFVKCDTTQLIAEVRHEKGSKRGYGITGSVRRLDETGVVSTGVALITIAGRIDGRVVATDTDTKQSFVIYDADVSAHREATTVRSDIAFDLVHDEKGTSRVWGHVVEAMCGVPPRWDDAREGKVRGFPIHHIKRRLIAHTRPAKGLLRPEGRIPSDCYPDCLRNTNPSYTWSERLTLSFLRARKKSSGANGKSEPRRRKTAKGLFCPRFLQKIIPWEPGSCARMSWRVGRSRGGRRERRRGGVNSRVGCCAVINQKIHRKLQPFFLRVFQRITVGFFHLLLHPHAAHPRARASLCRVVRHWRGVVPGYSLAVVVVRL